MAYHGNWLSIWYNSIYYCTPVVVEEWTTIYRTDESFREATYPVSDPPGNTVSDWLTVRIDSYLSLGSQQTPPSTLHENIVPLRPIISISISYEPAPIKMCTREAKNWFAKIQYNNRRDISKRYFAKAYKFEICTTNCNVIRKLYNFYWENNEWKHHNNCCKKLIQLNLAQCCKITSCTETIVQ